MRFIHLVCTLLFAPDEFFYQRARKRFHEAIARGENPPTPIRFYQNTSFGVDVRDIVVTQEFRKQCNAVEQIRLHQESASRS